MSVIFITGTVASILYFGSRAGNVACGISGRDIALSASIWRIGTWFLVAVVWSHSVWVVLMDVGMLGLIYRGYWAKKSKPGVSRRDISLAALIWRTWPWFLVAVAWSHGVWVVVIDVGILGLMLVRVEWWQNGGHRWDFYANPHRPCTTWFFGILLIAFCLLHFSFCKNYDHQNITTDMFHLFDRKTLIALLLIFLIV